MVCLFLSPIFSARVEAPHFHVDPMSNSRGKLITTELRQIFFWSVWRRQQVSDIELMLSERLAESVSDLANALD